MLRTLRIVAVAAALGVMATPVQGQLSFGVHGAVITSVDEVTSGTETFELSNTFGLGGRVIVSPPVFPISLVGSTEYYFTDCADTVECDLWTASAAVNLGLPMPIVRPYVTGGIQYRGDKSAIDSDSAWILGLGVQLNFAVSVFLEGVFEFVDLPEATSLATDFDASPFVLKGGLIF